MDKSNKSIITHIPDFLDSYKRKGYSNKTLENYERFLKKFIFWLKNNNKETLKPNELTVNDISNYITYLSECIDLKTSQNLKKTTQNYYLIALRAFLSYFSLKDIVSLSPDKIKLYKYEKIGRSENQYYLNLEQIKKLLSLTDINKERGLRDKIILEILISTGLKITQLINLNKEEIDDLIPRESLFWVKKYLRIRKDKHKALFINYRGLKKEYKRLTVRAIEKTLNKYGRLLNLPFSLTPETLRWSRAIALLNEENQPKIIQQPYVHQVYIMNNYEYKTENFSVKNKIQNSPTPWHLIESSVVKEMSWLKYNIPVLPDGYSYRKNPPLMNCDDCILRRLATLIVRGTVRAVEIRNKENKDLWNSFTKRLNIRKKIYHGKEWHKKMMNIIYTYFEEKRGYKIKLEPILNYGRADLGVYSNYSNNIIYIEVGTVSLYKLWYNLSTMKNITFLIIPSEEKIIELKV